MPLDVAWEELRIEFEGNRVFPSEQLREATEVCYRQRRDDDKDFEPQLLEYCLKNDMLDVMRRAGYVRARAEEPRAHRLGESVKLTVPLEENELFRTGRVTIEGAAHFDVKQLRELLPLKRGEIADSVAVRRWAFEHLLHKYADEGFIQYQADIDPAYRVEPGASEGVLDLTVTVNEGKRFKLGSVEFEGPADAPLDVLREALGLREGEFFGRQAYRDAVQRLNQHALFDGDGGRFEDVEQDEDVEFRSNEETGELDLRIRLTERGQERAARPGAEEDEGRPMRPALKRRP
jgi:outer membrane protein insertion porin family